MFKELQSARLANYLTVVLLASGVGCGPSESPPPIESRQTDVTAVLRDALLFHAGFDDGWDAGFAKGDRGLYTAPSYSEQEKATPGIGNPDVEIADDVGRFQHALKFSKKNEHAIFYRAEDNVAYSESGWNGTISFWLSLDPGQDLEPGFTDPIQVTDARATDACIWVDFTREDPRQFRLGVFGDLDVWNPEDLPSSENADFENHLVIVNEPPFARGTWTQVVITHEGLGSAQGGTARLYLDSELQGTVTGITEPFTWDMAGAAIRLGLNYVGLFDELAIFDRPLTEDEIQALYGLERGVIDLHP